MSIVTVTVTPDHRYFMRRTRSEIISRIEQMTGQRFDNIERLRMESMHKDELATLAMTAWRALPAPPDPVDVLVGVIITELRRQSDDGMVNYHVRVREGYPTHLVGDFDLRALACAILEGMPK